MLLISNRVIAVCKDSYVICAAVLPNCYNFEVTILMSELRRRFETNDITCMQTALFCE